MARRRTRPTTTPEPVRPVRFDIGFSFVPVALMPGQSEDFTIADYRDAQLKALRDAYVQSLGIETDEEISKRAKIATLIEIVQRVYGYISERSLEESEGLLNKAVWFMSMASGIRKTLHNLLSGTGTISPRTSVHVITAFLVEEIEEASAHLREAISQLTRLDERGLPVSPFTVRDVTSRSYVYETDTVPAQRHDGHSSLVTMPTYEDNSYLTIDANEAIREAVGHLIELVRTDETVRSYLNEEVQPSRTGPNRWQLVSGSNGIEGIILNGRRLNAQSIQVRAEPGSVTRINLEVLIVPTSDILSFTSNPTPGYSDGGLRNVITPTPTPSPSSEEPRHHQPANVRRLDI